MSDIPGFVVFSIHRDTISGHQNQLQLWQGRVLQFNEMCSEVQNRRQGDALCCS